MKRSMKISTHHAAAMLAALLGVTSLPGIASADDDVDEENAATYLASQPAVRHRLLLVKGRFELTPSFEATINADYRQTFGGGLKAEYHLTDMLSVGLVGIFGQSVNTSLVDRVLATLPATSTPGDPTPTRTEYEQHLNSMPLHGAAYVSITPWYGKLAAFGTSFVNFDFYFQGGVSIAHLTNTCRPEVCNDRFPTGNEDMLPDGNPNNDPALNDGTRYGLYLGGGVHVFVNNWMAIDFTVRDYLFSDNPSGLDFNADYAVTNDDNRFLNHLFMGVGVSIFFPLRAERTP